MRIPEDFEEQLTISRDGTDIFSDQTGEITKYKTQIYSISQIVWSYFAKRIEQAYIGFLIISVIIHIKNYMYFREIVICPYPDFNRCLNDYFIPLGQNQQTFGPYIQSNSIILFCQLHIFVQGKIHRFYSILSLIIFSWLYLLGDKEASIFNMIGLVKAVHIVLTINLVCAYLFIYGFYLCSKRVKYFKTILCTVLFLAIVGIVILKLTKQCSDWGEGINGRIENENGVCKMMIPNCHTLKAIAWTDFNYLYHNCYLGSLYKMEYNGYFSNDIQNGTIVAFEDFKNTTDLEASQDNIYQDIYSKAKRFKTLEQARKSEKKYDVLFDTEEQRYYIQINRNETLVKQKSQKWKQYQQSSSPPLSKNVLVIFLDAVSRFQLRLKLPKVYNWFKKRSVYHSYKQEIITNTSSKSGQTFQFYRFLSVASWTVPNIFAMSYNSPHDKTFYEKFDDRKGLALKMNETLNHKLRHFLTDYNERGFITGTTHSYCVPYLNQLFQAHIPLLQFPKFDHQTLSYNCDPNFIARTNTFDFMKGINAVTDRCLYHKRLAEYNIDHAESFFNKYDKQPKFYMLNFMQGHALMGGSVKYIDPDIVGFLNRLQKDGRLNDTTIIMLSDHGQHLSTYPSVIADHFNPFLMVYLPKSINQVHREKIRKNQQNTVSMHNIHHFLRHLAQGESYEKKHFGILGNLTEQKTCKDVLVYENDEYPPCYCR